MNTEKLFTEMNDARLISMGEHLLYPLLTKHVEQKLEVMCAKFRAGQKDFIIEIAEITYIKDLLSELQSIQTKGHKARIKLEQP